MKAQSSAHAVGLHSEINKGYKGYKGVGLQPKKRKEKRKVYASQKAVCIKERASPKGSQT
eukprot:1148182-Pelagomonas_calceolata.AAC.2